MSLDFHPSNIMMLNDEGGRGFVLQVDITIPTKHHDRLNQFPIAPEHLIVHEGLISDYSRDVRERRSYPEKFSQRKLCPNLYPKERYIVSLSNLQCFIRLGAVLTKIHRVVSFKQKARLKPYIDYRTARRRAATTEFQRRVEKLGVVSVFGKTLESPRKWRNVKFVSTPAEARTQTSKVEYKTFKIFAEDLVAVELANASITLNKPIPVGMIVLERSKKIVIDFFYDVILEKFPGAELILSDTDSLLLKVYTDDLIGALRDIKHLCDFSNLPTTHPLFSEENKDEPGKWKLETKHKVIEEVVALRSKLYSIQLVEDRKIAAAGVSRRVAMQKLSHQDYLDTLLSGNDKRISQKTFRSTLHTIHTVRSERIGLSAYQDKRYVCANGVDTLAYGHYSIST